MASELCNLAIAFLLTVILEIIVACLFGYRKRHEFAAIFWVNTCSYPLSIFLVLLISKLRDISLGMQGILILEIAVVLLEWQLLCFALPKEKKYFLFILSLTMNGISYVAGLLLTIW
jgi:hypothetical protein